MYIPTWFFWIVGIVVMLAIATWAGRSRGAYDFVSPLLSIGLILVGIAFGIGYLIAS